MQSDPAGLSASVFLSVLGSAALAGLSRVAHNGTDAEAVLGSAALAGLSRVAHNGTDAEARADAEAVLGSGGGVGGQVRAAWGRFGPSGAVGPSRAE